MCNIGSPGTGKTLTVGKRHPLPLRLSNSMYAECISQFTRQPLISLTGADLDLGRGTENKLKHWFNLAILWDAHLLIDEADVFVEHRTPKDLERNAMVSGSRNLLDTRLAITDIHNSILTYSRVLLWNAILGRSWVSYDWTWIRI